MAEDKVINDAAAMETAAKHVEDVNGQLTSELGHIRNLVAGSADHWKGAAQGAFQRIMADYDDQSKKLNDVLAEIAVQIRENGKGFSAQEQANQDRLAALGASGDLDSGSSLNI